MPFRQATLSDLTAVCDLYQAVCESMNAAGVSQWRWGEYPNEDMIRGDIALGQLYVLDGAKEIAAAACVNCTQDPEYGDVRWLFGTRPGSFHRLAIHPAQQGKGLFRYVLAEVEAILTDRGCDCLRIDTYSENMHARSVYARCGMREAGTVRFAHRPLPFICFEKPLTPDCPLLPLPMTPAFRGGALTPWGGEKLGTMFGKAISQPTGESLEVSCIPELESRDPADVPLPRLIARYGAKLVGQYVDKPFPLLLKLLDAKNVLSVQVHPGDDYAREHEGGKLGKTEAWVILDAPEGSELIYGLRPGVDTQTLRDACEQGAAVEPLLRRVKVKPGDVCFIPAGCIHAIGAGIVLYEIQQSSDVTYRFYDWNRTDALGRRRPLHIDKALAVADLRFAADPVPAPDAPYARVLDTPCFRLELLRPDGELRLPHAEDFAFLTALEADMTLRWEGGSMPVKKGQTVLIPAAAPALTLAGCGRAALAMP
ncbi:MAG: GNAT family N-acetyltransferase [Clostridia bacterium]|nr:GNAT family N-acetyltransferase [Clostridia bacterium]